MSKYFVNTGPFIVPEYKKNKNGLLVKIGEIDEFEKIQENKNCALDIILDKFLVPLTADDSVVDDTVDFMDLSGSRDNLLEAAEWKNKLNEYRIMFGLDPACSDQMVIAELQKRSDDYKKNIERNLEKKGSVENEETQVN